MSDPYVGEIKLFGGNFAPRGWATCDGQIIAISQNTSLFSLVGTYYGGNGQTTFALPDLRGRTPVNQGTNPTNGLSYNMGDKGGAESIVLEVPQLPMHTHSVIGSADAASTRSPAGSVPAAATRAIYGPPGAAVAMASGIVTSTGSSLSHDNLMPFLTVTYIIALQGVYPSR